MLRAFRSNRRFILVMLYFITAACSSHSQHEFQFQASQNLSELIIELKKIHEPVDLLKNQNRLRKKFYLLTKSIIKYSNYLNNHPEVINDIPDRLKLLSNELRIVLSDIYSLDGAREIIEEIQNDCILVLNSHQNKKKGDRINLYESPKLVFKES